MLDIGRGLCSDPHFSAEREWLVTNGIGGYASGTIAGVLTRRYHGLLVAALQPPVGRTLLLTKLDETATYDGRSYPLFANRWSERAGEPGVPLPGALSSGGHYAGVDLCLRRRSARKTHLDAARGQYHLHTLRPGRASGPLKLKSRPSSITGTTTEHASRTTGRCTSNASDAWPAGDGSAKPPVLSPQRPGRGDPAARVVRGFLPQVEDYRGLDALEDNLYAGLFQATLSRCHR